MYIPASFLEHRTPVLHELMQAYPLGQLVSHGRGGLQASPVPFLLYPDEGEFGVLRAHVARANPHWKELVDLDECLVVFQGLEGYVPPSWYPGKAQTHKAVPTWNYACVHAWGRPQVIEDAAWLLRQLNDLTDHHEQRRPQPWSVGHAPVGYVAAQIRAIVGIEIPVRKLEGKFKMSQNRNAPDRAGVVEGLRDTDDPHHNIQLADRVERS
jgi:transcriptional regulator